MIGYEWTSVPGGNNLHRNVLFRDNKDKADQILPFSAWQSEDPEKLWEWMAKYEAEDRRQAARHPAQRQPLERPDVRAGGLRRQPAVEGLRRAPRPLGGAAGDDADQGHQRDAPALSPNDEFADFGIAGWEYGNLTLEGEPLSHRR